jgi:hypothetical protein
MKNVLKKRQLGEEGCALMNAFMSLSKDWVIYHRTGLLMKISLV